MFRKIFHTIKELGSLGPLLAFAVIAPGVGAFLLAATSNSWYEALDNSGSLKLLIFFSAGILLSGLSLIPTHAVSLLAGMLFGATLGPLYAVSVISIASLLSYIIAGAILGDKTVNSIKEKPQANAVYQELLKDNGFRTFMIISLVRLSPIMPFAATNVLLSGAKVRFSEFLSGSIIGLSPRVFIVAIAGAGLNKLDLSQQSHQGLLILGIAATILAIAIVGYFSKRVLKKFATTPLEDT